MSRTDNEYDAVAYAFASALYADRCMAKRPAPMVTCAGTRPVSGQCRTTAEEAPREHVGRKWSLQPMGRGEGLTFSEARTVGYDVTLEAGTERVHFNVSSDDTPEVLERKAREAVEKWKASE